MKKFEFITLPNGLSLCKLMQYKPTKEKCQITKVNPEVIETNLESPNFGKLVIPLTVDIILFRELDGIPYKVPMKNISQYDLTVWNENMNQYRVVTYKRRKKPVRTILYAGVIK